MVTIQCESAVFNGLRAVLFDKDGTLADISGFIYGLGDRRSAAVDKYVPGTGKPLRQALGLHKHSVDMQGALAVASRFENEVSAATFIAAQGFGWSDALAIAQKAFAEVDADMGNKATLTPPFDDAQPCLERLLAAGLKLGIVSADSPRFVQGFVDHYQWRSLCSVALGSTPDCLKPNPQLLYRACDRLEVNPEEVLVVGDASSDVALGRQGGSAGVVILRRDSRLKKHDFGADAHIQTLDELIITA